MKNKLFISGGSCSGKSYLATSLARTLSYQTASFGSILRNYSIKEALSSSTEALQGLGYRLIEDLGYKAFLEWVIKHAPQIDWEAPLVLDGVRHINMYVELARKFPSNLLIHCRCGREEQIKRMVTRDNISHDKAVLRLQHPLETEMAALEASAHLIYDSGDDISTFAEILKRRN